MDSNERIFEKQGSFFQRGGAGRGEGRQREPRREGGGWNRRTRNRRRDDERGHDDWTTEPEKRRQAPVSK